VFVSAFCAFFCFSLDYFVLVLFAVVMAALRAGHYVLVLWSLFSSSSFFFLFFLAYSQPSQIECLPYFHIWCGLSANLE